MMQQPPTLAVDQALFGYSDGHRQLAGSIELSSSDAYELATRSDLESNARLGPGASYVGGFPLKESGAFAYIKTWLAPEMPRPGCVWSHALILPRTFLTGQVNLGILRNLFQRPALKKSLDDYRTRLVVKRLAKCRLADREQVKRVISAYYNDNELLYEEVPGEDFEEALLAAWSQQWPKLRSEFLFRTVFGSTVVLDKGLIIRIAAPKSRSITSETMNATRSPWISAAVDDATSRTITQLRRFLWRYGKDTTRPRTAFEILVRLYLGQLTSSKPSIEEILKAFPKPLDAITLKRDVLGAPTGAPPLMKRLDGQDFVSLVTRVEAVQSGLIKRTELSDAIASFSQDDLRRAAITLGALEPPLSFDAGVIKDAVARFIGSRALADESMPRKFAIDVLRMRPELIEEFDATELSELEVVHLLDVASSRGAIRRLIGRLMSSPPSEGAKSSVERRVGEAFVEAVRLSMAKRLHEGWRQVFPRHAREAISNGLGDLNGSGEVGEAVALIDFSTDHRATPFEFAVAADRDGPKATADERTALDAYLLVLSMQSGLAGSMEIVAEVLPRLRNVALANGFSTRTRTLLDEHLPYISDTWDLNKRLLKVLRRARRDGVNIDSAITEMHLSKLELLYVCDEDEHYLDGLFTRMLWPWYRGQQD